MIKSIALLACLGGGVAQAATTVPLAWAPLGNYINMFCAANYWDAAGVIPSGACQGLLPSIGSGRGGGYVKGAIDIFPATWDLFGNLTMGPLCGTRAKYVTVQPPVVYATGYDAANCSAWRFHQSTPYVLNGLAYYVWIGPSLAGEYIVDGRYLILP